MTRSTKQFAQFAVIISIGGVLLWNILAANNVFSSAALQDSAERVVNAPDQRKPGEPEGYAPSPVPDMPMPENVPALQPGQPALVKQRPPQEELDRLANRIIPPDTPYRMEFPSEHVAPDSFTAAVNSNTIVLARVSKIHPARWLSPDGKRPANPYDFDNPTFIFTLLDILIEDTYKGNSGIGDILTLQISGGQVGDDVGITTDYRYKFNEGQLVLLYLYPALPEEADLMGAGPVWYVRERYDIDATTKMASALAPVPEVRPLEELVTEIQSPRLK